MKRPEGRPVQTVQRIKEALLLRRGGNAQVWDYQVSHQWLTIRLEKRGLAGNFHLRCGGCDRVSFETWWEPANFEVQQYEHGYIVHDGANLRIECGLIEGEYNVSPVFDLS